MVGALTFEKCQSGSSNLWAWLLNYHVNWAHEWIRRKFELTCHLQWKELHRFCPPACVILSQLLHLPVDILCSLMRVTGHRLSPQQFSVFLITKLAEVNISSLMLVRGTFSSSIFCNLYLRCKRHVDTHPLVYHCRGNHVWRSLATVWVLSDHWRAESDVPVLPGKHKTQESLVPFFSVTTPWFS